MTNTDSILHDIRTIIENGRRAAYEAVGHTAIATYWNIGRRIVEEEQDGKERAKYGTQLIKNIAETLVPLYGSNYSKRNLDYYKKFYLLFQDFEIVNTRVHNLDWSHIRRVLSVANEPLSHVTRFCTTTSNFSPPNIWHICRQRRSYAERLNIRNNSF